MKRFFRRASPTSRQELERQAAKELQAASGLPTPAQDHPAGRGGADEVPVARRERKRGRPGRSWS